MSLSYHFSFSAPATVAADELLEFLETVETEAKQMGFKPTMVLEAEFDTPERREFARRVVRAIHIEDEQLQGVVLPVPEQVRDFSPNTGHCRLEPERAVILVVTDERGHEAVFGFARYPATLKDIHGRVLLKTLVGDKWLWQDFVDSGDPRFRRIVKRFAESGYLQAERDEFVAA
ncbi:MAG TPA: hypothetical protein VFC17_07675 [Candidatus Limnocylindrales bacterium]|nr:hypothetical protein [Candidatus Limnocylindrales bacterium]